jgi:hypothetical protein
MPRAIPAALAVAVCWAYVPAYAQDPVPVPVTRREPGTGKREPVNTTPREPAPPVKVDVAESTPPAPDATNDEGEREQSGGSKNASAQRPGGGGGGGSRGGTRGGGRVTRGRPGTVYPVARPVAGWRAPLFYTRPYYYDPFWMGGAFGWSPMFYAPWSLMWGTAGYWPWPGSTTFSTGNVRLKIKPREAQVLVDGYVAGIVDEFDGVFQSLRLAPGGHKIEVRLPGYTSLTFDVHVQPDRTMTLTETMKVNP